MSDPASTQWLSGTRVLEFSQFKAAPLAGVCLARFGAEVIKVEHLTGDPTRHYPARIEGESASFLSFNVGKRPFALDFKHVRAAEVLERLVGSSDVFLQNLRPGLLERFGWGPERIHAINPSTIYCSIQGFYPSESGRLGYDTLAQAESGIMSMTPVNDRGPTQIPITAVDAGAGQWAAIGILAALQGSRESVTLRVSLMDVAMNLVDTKGMSYFTESPGAQPGGGMVPSGNFPTADGLLYIVAGNDEHFRCLASVLGPPLADNADYARLADRMERREQLRQEVADLLTTRTADEWCTALSDAGVPVAVVRDLPDAIERHRELSPTGFLGPATPLAFAPPVEVFGSRWTDADQPGPVGSATRDILASVGFSDEEVDDLARDRVIGV